MSRQRRLAPPPGRRVRLADLATLEIRQSADLEGPIGFSGVAAVFDVRARIGGDMLGFLEVVESGAFAESLASDDIRMLKNHNTDLVLARNRAGNLRLSETVAGLEVDADMTPTTYARDLALSLSAGDISQMSFGFEVLDEEWRTLDDDDPDKGLVVEPELRIVKRVKLWEVSPVTFPAYLDTEAELKLADLELVARSLGLDDDRRLREHAAAIRGSSTTNPSISTAPAIEPATLAIGLSPAMPAGHARYGERRCIDDLFPTRRSR